MNVHRSHGLVWLMIVLGSGAALGAEANALATLKGKGLTKTGVTFTVEEVEAPVLTRIKDVHTILTHFQKAADERAELANASQVMAQLEERRSELQDRLDDLNQQINEQGLQGGGGMPRPGGGGGGFGQGGNGFGGANMGGSLAQLIAQRNQIKAPLDAVSREQKALKASLAVTEDRKVLDEQMKGDTDHFQTVLDVLRPLVDQATRRYADLAADPTVKTALRDLEASTKAKFRVGPSDAFKAAVKTLDQAERTILGHPTATTSRKKTRTRR